MKKLAVIAAAGLMALTACGGVSKDATYEKADDLLNAATQSGYDCPTREVKSSRYEGSVDEGRCKSANRDLFVVFSTPAALDSAREGFIFGTQLIMTDTREDAAVLVGPNWIIRGPKDEVIPLKEKLGGYLPDISHVRMP